MLTLSPGDPARTPGSARDVQPQKVRGLRSAQTWVGGSSGWAAAAPQAQNQHVVSQ